MLLELLTPVFYKDRGIACRTAKDFYERTRGHDRITASYDDRMVMRYIDRLEVFPNRIDVVFKGEIKIGYKRKTVDKAV